MRFCDNRNIDDCYVAVELRDAKGLRRYIGHPFILGADGVAGRIRSFAT